MLAGIIEIQLMAQIARLSEDMKQAERVVGTSMGKVEKHVASAKSAMSKLGMGLGIGIVADQLRRTVDQYTKLDAQLRLSTRSQDGYNQALEDVRRISAVAQADISATTMLYTRLNNVVEGTGVTQKQVATVTETIAYGLKAYGATAAEAASASLQLSQAFGSNRLGGEEFRAVMEAMPNVMKSLATSMNVPLGNLRNLSIAGKITAAEMVKAWGNTEIAAQYKAMAESTKTVTGAWTVARNELTLLIGQVGKASGIVSGAIAVFEGIAGVIRITAKYIDDIIAAITIWAAVTGGKLVVSLVSATMAQAALNAAQVEAIAVNLAMARAEAASALVARDVTAARVWQTGVTTGMTAANTRLAASAIAVANAEKLQAAGSIGVASKVKGAVGKAGWIGMALFGAWTVYDFLSGMQQIADGAKDTASTISELSLAELQVMRQKIFMQKVVLEHSYFANSLHADEINLLKNQLAQMDAQIEKTKKLGKVAVTVAEVEKSLYDSKMGQLRAELEAKLESEGKQLTQLQRVELIWMGFAETKYKKLTDEQKLQERIARDKDIEIAKTLDLMKLHDEYDKIKKESTDSGLSPEDKIAADMAKELADLEEKRAIIMAATAGNQQLERDELELHLQAKKAIEDRYANDEIKREGGIRLLVQQFRQADYKNAMSTADKLFASLTIRHRAAFNVLKAARISEAVITGKTAVVAAWKHGSEVGGVFGGIAEGALAAAIVASQIADINATQFGGGDTGSSAGSMSSGAGASVGSGTTETRPAAQPIQQTNKPVAQYTAYISGVTDTNKDEPMLSYNQTVALMANMNLAAANGHVLNFVVAQG